MSKLPSDILIGILSSLPTKTLVRFRSLSKPCCSLIDSPYFVKLQLDHSIETNTNHVLIVEELKLLGSLYAFDLDSADKAGLAELTSPRFARACCFIDYSDVYGSCNGLLAVHDHVSGTTLWNPSTGESQLLPNFWGKRSFGDNYRDGFGYDPVSDDYKVIRMIQSVEKNHFEGFVYNVKNGSSRKVEDLPYCAVELRDSGVLVGAALHWKVRYTVHFTLRMYVIVAFDLVHENFNVVPTSPVLPGNGGFAVGALGGRLSIGCKNNDEGCVDLWVMKEYGVEESWSKLYSLSPEKHEMIYSCMSLKPLGYAMSGNALLLLQDNRRLLRFDLEKEKEKEEIVEVFGGGPRKINANKMQLCPSACSVFCSTLLSFCFLL